MPIIILEGIDGSGKSTLAQQLVASSPIPARYEHRGPLKSTVQNELIKPLLAVKSNELLVTDRWHVGETIYGPIYRGESLVAGYWNELIEGLLQDLGAVKVIMAPELETVKTRLAARGEDYLQPQHVDEVYKAYLDYALKYNYLLLDATDDNIIQDLLEEAIGGSRVAA